MNTSVKQAIAAAVIAYNDSQKRIEIKKEIRIGRLRIIFNWRSSKNLWGRFGAGWNWVVGVQVGSSTVIFNLLICSVQLSYEVKR